MLSIITIACIFMMHGIVTVRILNPCKRKGLSEEKSKKVLYSILQVIYYSFSSYITTKYIYSDNYTVFGFPTETSDDLISIQLGWYIYNLVLDRNKMDMLSHHITAISLLIYTRYVFLDNFGLAICLVHDISDPFLHVAKLFNYSEKYSMVRDGIFGLFAIIFLVTRLYIFPYMVWSYIDLFGFTTGTLGLFLLQILHVYWSWLIIKVVSKVITGSEVKDDD
jgi:hypothetical protein